MTFPLHRLGQMPLIGYAQAAMRQAAVPDVFVRSACAMRAGLADG